jgi:IS605 OrfB family transposase
VVQSDRLEAHCAAEDYSNILPIADLGSGLNYKKKGLKRLFSLLLVGKVSRIVMTYKDRLLRFGSELIFAICVKTGKPIACEELDFATKKRSMYPGRKRSSNRWLSSFAYNKVLEAIASTSNRHGIDVQSVNPAYTSFIGAVKYHRLRQNLSHCAAAIIIARRALGFKESPPSEVQTGEPVKFHYKWQNVALKFVSPCVSRNTDLKPDVLFWRDLFKLVSAQKARMLRETLRGSKSSRLLKCGNVSLTSLVVWGCHDQV